MTLPLIAALPNMNASERSAVERVFADPEPSAESVRVIIDAVNNRGGLEGAREEASIQAAKARERLASLPQNEFVSGLYMAVDFVVERVG